MWYLLIKLFINKAVEALKNYNELLKNYKRYRIIMNSYIYDIEFLKDKECLGNKEW